MKVKITEFYKSQWYNYTDDMCTEHGTYLYYKVYHNGCRLVIFSHSQLGSYDSTSSTDMYCYDCKWSFPDSHGTFGIERER